jgi:hypothetical protein
VYPWRTYVKRAARYMKSQSQRPRRKEDIIFTKTNLNLSSRADALFYLHDRCSCAFYHIWMKVSQGFVIVETGLN